MTGLVVCLAVLAAASVYGVIHRRRDGRVRVRAKDGEERLTAADLGGPLGERATLVQFSSAFCAPCRATRRVLGEVADMVEGVRHIEIDAEAHLELVHAAEHTQDPDRTGACRRRLGRAQGRRAAAPRRRDRGAGVGGLSGEGAM